LIIDFASEAVPLDSPALANALNALNLVSRPLDTPNPPWALPPR